MGASPTDGPVPVDEAERARLTAERERIRSAHLAPRDDRSPSTARGVHHVALVSSDVERTVRFYQDLLGFPLTTMFENRDLPGSTHFFFDIGHGNSLAFFDLPGVDPGPYAEVLGGLHHLAISMEVASWEAAKARLDEAGVPYAHIDGTSIYFRGPDGERLELIADPLRWMYGSRVD
jgi:catechol 2,3-dioxygenase-like lactoylglutathione lyase family enzyme